MYFLWKYRGHRVDRGQVDQGIYNNIYNYPKDINKKGNHLKTSKSTDNFNKKLIKIHLKLLIIIIIV